MSVPARRTRSRAPRPRAHAPDRRRRRSAWNLGASVAVGVVLSLAGLATHAGEATRVERITVDFPHGGSRLTVEAGGEATLAYGALPRTERVRPGVFDVRALHEELAPMLRPNVPREDWPRPGGQWGMVHVELGDGRSRAYLIRDAGQRVRTLFQRARANLIGVSP